MLARMRARALCLGFAFALALVAPLGCSAALEEDDVALDEEENAVKVDTRSPAARAQYDANVAFANSYRPRCTGAATPGRKRVLVTGYGRFQSITNNATGRMVASLVPGMAYPETVPAPSGQVDPPAPQLSVALGKMQLPNAGEVDVCAMVLPVFWDLAAILVAKEAEAFGPDLVLMNGVAGSRQDVWIELGAVNRAVALEDGSENLRPLPDDPSRLAPILTSGPSERANLMSWRTVLSAAQQERDALARETSDDTSFGDVVRGAKLAGFPRSSNTYLCNNVTYAMGHLMDNPGLTVSLLRASPRVAGKPNDVRVRITRDLRNVPRAFMHWPSELARVHTASGARVMRAVIDAQLSRTTTDAPTRGDKRDAAPDLAGGPTF
jgi:pyrrolidone-carboxylate peptidase